MKYDFTSILDRRGKDAAAYDNVGAHVIAPARPKEGFDIIPMFTTPICRKSIFPCGWQI